MVTKRSSYLVSNVSYKFSNARDFVLMLREAVGYSSAPTQPPMCFSPAAALLVQFLALLLLVFTFTILSSLLRAPRG